MDPLTQGTLGAALSGAVADSRKVRAYAIAGAAAGLAPDLDIFIRSATDPLLYLEFHRQFSHSLLFIPLGAGLVALLLFGFLRKQLSWLETYLACLLGYATHGLLDACTSYGTQLFWPFSTLRVSWNWISVVDPLFMLPLLAFVGIAWWRRQPRFALLGLSWAVLYMIFGAVQHERAHDAALQLIAARGQQAQRLVVKPGFANLIVWKAVYEYEDHYYVDGIRVAGDAEVCPGDRIPAQRATEQLAWLDGDSQQGRDLERFRWYSDDWLALDRDDPLYVVDVRYSSMPNRIDPLWGLKLDPQGPFAQHAVYHVSRSRRTAGLDQLMGLLAGRGCEPLAD